MTRKSVREIESALDALRPTNGHPGARDVHAWVSARLRESADTWGEADPGARYTVLDADGEVIREPDHTGQVCIWQAHGDAGTEFWIDADELPEWIDAEADLPVVG